MLATPRNFFPQMLPKGHYGYIVYMTLRRRVIPGPYETKKDEGNYDADSKECPV